MKRTKTTAELQALKKQLDQDLIVARAGTTAEAKANVRAIEAQLEACDMQMENAALHASEDKRKGDRAEEAIKAMTAQGLIPAQDADRIAQYRKTFIDNPDSIELIAGAAIKQQQTSAIQAAGGNANAALTGNGASTATAQALAARIPANITSLAQRMSPNAQALTASAAEIPGLAVEIGASYGLECRSASSGWDCKRALSVYAELQAANNRLRFPIKTDHEGREMKHRLSVEAGIWYNKHLRPMEREWESLEGWALQKLVSKKPLQAADYTDPNNELGTLSGTLVLQRTLPVFAWAFPEFGAMTTDFSDAPGLFEQAERTRIVTQPTVQVYSITLISANFYVTSGVPGGWLTAVEGTDTDVTLTLTDYVGVPIAIGNNILAATTRRLFDEQAVLAIKAIAQYLATMVTNLFVNTGTAPNSANSYNYYTTANGTTVPIAYPTYPVSSATFSMKDVDNLDAAFTSAKVPEDDRFLLLNPLFYSRLRGDSRLEFLYAASAKDVSTAGAGDFLTEAKLPKLSGFAPYKAGYMPTAAPQPTVVLPAQTPTLSNIVGFAGQKAGIIMKARLPMDFNGAVNATAPGTITTVTDPDTKISIMLVQFINLQQNYAMWRPEVMLGTTVGDNRAGLVLTGS